VPGHGGVPLGNVVGEVRLIVMPFARFQSVPSVDPHATPVGMGAGVPDGAPAALGLLAVLPLLRRRAGAPPAFLPPPARRRTPGGGTRFRDTL
jgi:hypothetical protein